MEKKKDPVFESQLDELSQKVFGRSRKENVCVICGSESVKDSDFKDDISRKEFNISRMCQVCQDEVFEENECDCCSCGGCGCMDSF